MLSLWIEKMIASRPQYTTLLMDGYSLQIRRYTLVASSSQESLVLEVLPRQGIRSLWREAYLPIAASVGVMTMAVQHTNN